VPPDANQAVWILIRGSYRGIKLLEHAMKVVQRIFEHRIQQQIEIDDMQFGFIGKTDAGEF